MRGDIIYNSNTQATMNAATTNIMMKGRRSHQELIKSQSAIDELNPSSEDMGKAVDFVSQLKLTQVSSANQQKALVKWVKIKFRGGVLNSLQYLQSQTATLHKLHLDLGSTTNSYMLPRVVVATFTKTNTTVHFERAIMLVLQQVFVVSKSYCRLSPDGNLNWHTLHFPKCSSTFPHCWCNCVCVPA